MGTTMWILLTTGISVLMGTGLTVCTCSLVAYGQWRRKLNVESLHTRKTARKLATAKIAELMRFPHLQSNFDEALASYGLDQKTLAAVKNFLQAHQKKVGVTHSDYTDLFSAVEEILINYERQLKPTFAVTNRQVN